MFETLEQAQKHFDNIGMKHANVRAELKSADGEENGSVKAVFSIFDVLDTDGDVVLSSSFKNGQEVGMIWSHTWGTKPIGKGIIRVEGDQAVFDGKFFLDTFDGNEAYKTVKNMGELQEWSWGFKVLDSDIVEDDSSPFGYKRIIKNTEVYEVSPVLIGANRGTSTLSIKTNSDTFKQFVQSEIERLMPSIVEKVALQLKNAEESDTIVPEEEVKEEKNGADLREKAQKAMAEFEFMRYEEALH